MDTTDVCAEARRVRVFGDRDEDFNVVGCGATFELRSRLEFPCVSAISTDLVTES